MSSKKEKISRIGMLSKGIVYLLIGTLTALATFGQDVNKTGSRGALQFLKEQSFGQILLLLIGIGLFAYLFLRFYQAISNLKNHDNDIKGYLMRGSYIVSGLVYGFLGFTALKMVFGNSNSNSNIISNVLNSDYGNSIAIIVAIVLLGKTIYEFYMGYSAKFKEEVEHANIDSKGKKFIINAGKVGYTARGIVAAILSFLFFKVGMSNSSSTVNRTDAFNFLQNEFGTIIMVIVALGIATYGIFMIIKSKYPDINIK